MDRERFQRAADLFEHARQLPAAEREPYLDEQTGDDAPLRAEVLTLLRHYDEASADTCRPWRDALAHPASPCFTMSALSPHASAARDATNADAHNDDPEMIGRYRIISRIAEGGMGVVYLAEQDQPRREVAVKVIKPGMDSAAVIARFEQERQALAVLDHPCVAKVLDAGTTDRSLPYFVMEYVQGIPITEFCDRHAQNIEQRLRLFIRVCEAVQHAHAKGVIHRDLKPSNILVSEEGTKGSRDQGIERGSGTKPRDPSMPRSLDASVKIIDFGVAKALKHHLTERTIFTEQGQLIGTPEYMSPEQAEMSGQDIDTRADVYSLGVVLYELLTGALPFDSSSLRSQNFSEIQRTIREVEPPRPSARLNSAKPQAAMDVSPRRFQGDLDWIVMKCLEKDRDRRYDTANALAMDLKRHLNNEPVLAGPPSTVYRIRKFVRRNRAPVAAASLVAAALMIATVVSVTYALAEYEQRRIAEAAQTEAKQRAAQLEQVVEFQQEQLSSIDVPLMGVRMRLDLLERSREHLSQSLDDQQEIEHALAELERIITGVNFTDAALKALDENIFDWTLAAIDEQFADQPLIRARLLQTLADTMRRIGLLARATSPQEEALRIRREILGEEHRDTLFSISNMGLLLQEQGRYAEAEPYYRAVLASRRRTLGDDHPDTLIAINNIGVLLMFQGKLVEAEPYAREVLANRRRVLGDDHRDTRTAISNMGGLLERQGKLAEAEPYYQEALEGHRRVLGDEHPQTLRSINNMGALLVRMGRYAEAEPYFSEALAGRRRVLGDEHPITMVSVSNMGSLLQRQGRHADAEPYFRQALETRRRTFGEEHPGTLRSHGHIGLLLREEGRLLDAEHHLDHALTGSRRTHGDQHPDTLKAIHNLGSLLRDLGDLDRADSLGAEAVRTARRIFPPDHWHTAAYLAQHGRTLAAMERFEEAEERLFEAYSVFESSLGAQHRRTIGVIQHLADLYDAWHDADPDAGHDDRAAEWRQQLAPPD